MGSLNIYNTSGSNKASLTFTGSSDVTVDSNNLSGLTSNVQTQLGQMIGVGQTWQDVTSSRVLGTTYTNTTGKPIMVVIADGTYNAGQLQMVINGIVIIQNNHGNNAWSNQSHSYIIPNNSTYSVIGYTTPYQINKWLELR